MTKKRGLILILDMLAGHWDENVIVPSTGLQPPNVMGYVNAGKLPNFQKCIEKGTFVYSLNKEECNTRYGQKYLASGTYKVKCIPATSPFVKMTEGQDKETILYSCKKTYPEGKTASFGSDAWMQTGWWKAPDTTYGWGSYFSDFLTTQYCFKWMLENPDWNMVLLYLAEYDKTGNCPVFEKDAAYTKDKHHSLLQLDKFIWMVKTFLKEKGWWDETYVFIGSDHGCHYGCNIAVEEGIKRGIPKTELSNYYSNHQDPHNCYLWDFEKNKITDKRIDGCRRTTFIVSGGALAPGFRGKTIKYGEIIDFSPTIAKLMGIDFSGDGKSVI